ncbi:MAG: ABC transporter permease [Clostridia bacterium]|nr:ABC transporter permease [Clostridia bacterium]
MNGAQKVDKRKVEINKFSLIFNKLGIYVVVLLLIVAGVILSGGQFFSASNIQSILEASALIGMVSAGLMFVVYSGNMNDMSIPMTMAMAGMLTVQFINLGFIPALLIGIASGALIGFINGLMIGKFRAHPIIWSWGFNLLLSGIVRVVWQGKQLYADTVAKPTEFAQRAANTFYAISRTYLTSFISLMAVVMIVMFVIAWFIHSKTSFGQKLKIIGTNYDVAKFSGINCTKVLITAYMICGVCAATGGIFFSALRKTSSYENGMGYDFSCLTTVLLGGVQLCGGKGSVIGAFGGVLAYSILNNILSWIGLDTYSKYLVQGIVFLFIVWLNTYSNRKLGKA